MKILPAGLAVFVSLATQIPGFIGQERQLPPVQVPEGFTAIFNGRDLTGWHVSKTNHHGITPNYYVDHGMILGTQRPLGGGGIVLTDRSYKNVEVYLEVKPDWGCDSGLFLRSDEAGNAYQVTLDYLEGGTVGGMYGEGLSGVKDANTPPRFDPGALWAKAWKREEWNRIRARIEGDVPRVQAWVNDQQVLDFTDTANHASGGITEGPIAIQIHGGDRWVPGGFWRWRVIAVKALP
jgi:hypothetical protein